MPKRQIFRKGQDIFNIEGETARRIPLPEFQEKFSGTDASQFGAVEDLGEREDLFNQFFPESNVNIAEDIANEGNDIVDGDTSLREDETEIKSDADGLTGDIDEATKDFLGAETFAESDEGSEALDDLASIRNSLGILTPRETQQIERQAQAVGGQFDVLIEQAKREKKQGLAKAEIRAGERGGFQSTQFAGLAALVPTEGGDFLGIGGALEKIKSTYDLNIQSLQSQRINAMEKARSSAESAIKTGKQRDLDNAINLFNVAKTAHDDTISLQKEKVDAMATLRKEQQDTIKFLQTIPDGDAVTFNGVTYTGIGQPEPFFTGANFVSIAQSLPMGEETILTDPNTGEEYTIRGIESPGANFKSIQTTNSAGEVTITTFDPSDVTGTMTQVSAGKIGKATGGSGASKQFSFSSGAITNLLGAGFTNGDVSNIEQNIRDGFSIDEIIEQSDLGELQKNALHEAFGSEKMFITTDHIGKIIGDDLKKVTKAAKKAGFIDENDTALFMTEIENWVKQQRSNGFTDKEIDEALNSRIATLKE